VVQDVVLAALNHRVLITKMSLSYNWPPSRETKPGHH